jgi:SET domain-containing protein
MSKNLSAIKKKIINNLKNTYCRLQPSKIEGIGVFAIRNIPKNINPFKGEAKQEWYEIDHCDCEKFDKEILKMVDDFFVIEKNKKILVPELGLNGMSASYFVNHASKANLRRNNRGDFFTKRKIKKGEELLVDYGTYDWKYSK